MIEVVKGQGSKCINNVRATQKNDLPFLQLLNARHPPLRIRHHLGKQIRKGRLAQLCRLGAVERPVINCLAVRRVSKPGISYTPDATAVACSSW